MKINRPFFLVAPYIALNDYNLLIYRYLFEFTNISDKPSIFSIVLAMISYIHSKFVTKSLDDSLFDTKSLFLQLFDTLLAFSHTIDPEDKYKSFLGLNSIETRNSLLKEKIK